VRWRDVPERLSEGGRPASERELVRPDARGELPNLVNREPARPVVTHRLRHPRRLHPIPAPRALRCRAGVAVCASVAGGQLVVGAALSRRRRASGTRLPE